MENNYWDYKELIEATMEELEELLDYEILMFRKTCKRIICSKSDIDQFEKNLLLESLAVHTRLLVDFFYGEKKNRNDIITQDLLPQEKDWKIIRPPLTEKLKNAKKKADKQLAHLSRWRIKIKKEGKKPWDCIEIWGDMEKVIKKFEELKIKNIKYMDFKNRLENIKLQLFNCSVGDIFKCIDGNALIAAFLQCFCIIDYMAYIRNKLSNEKSAANYKQFVKDFLKKYDSEQLYAIRCALVHTYGHADAMEKAKLIGYSFTHKNPERHLIYENFVLRLNLSDFSYDIVSAVWNCFEEIKEKSDDLFYPITRGERLIKIFDPEGRIKIKENFGQIHSCLSPLDLKNWGEFRQKVYDLCLSKP